MKRTITRIILIAATLCIPLACIGAADLKDPKVILKKSREYVLSLESFEYNNVGEGWDTNPEASAQRVSASADEAAKKFGSVANVAKDVKKEADNADTSKWVKKRYETINRFKKPYLVQSKCVMSDYTPKIIWDSILTYRPDKDPGIFYFKPKISPVGIKRDITSESGGLPAQVFFTDYAILDVLSKNLKPTFLGTKKIGDKSTYAIAFTFPKDHKFKNMKIDSKKWGVPKEAQPIFEKEVTNNLTDKYIAKSIFYFDKTTLLAIVREDYLADGKLLRRREWSRIKVNSLTDKDF